MRLRLAVVDDNDEEYGQQQHTHGPCQRRFRAPSFEDDSSSDLDPTETFGGEHPPDFSAFQYRHHQPQQQQQQQQPLQQISSGFCTPPNRKPNQRVEMPVSPRSCVIAAPAPWDLLQQMEQSCEQKALHAVSNHPAYQTLWQTVQKTRVEAETSLLHQESLDKEDQDLQQIIRRNLEMERTATEQLKRLRLQEQSGFQAVQKELERFKAIRAAQLRAEQEAQEQEEARHKQLLEAEARQAQQKTREKQEKDAERAKEIQQQAEQAKQEQIAKEKQKLRDQIKKQQEEARVTRQKQATEYIELAHQRIAKLKQIQTNSEGILASTDPKIKKTRVDVKLQAGACNQISAAPSAIRMVVDKIRTLLQQAKAAGDVYFNYAMDLVATNLTKQARVVLDYKACYPVAYVIMMSCVQTPELTNVILAYFNQMCVYTIPETPVKTSTQSVAEYKRAMGFEDAIGDTSDPDKLEHVTVYTKRMTMMVAVLAAVMQTSPWDGSAQPKGLSIGDCWVWLARIVNEPPHLMTGSLILTIFEVAGFELLRTYKKQFHKLLLLIAKEVGPHLSKNAKTGAANAAGQLETLIMQYQANGCVLAEPAGRKLEETKVSAADEERLENGGNGGGNFGGYGGGRGGRGGGRGGRGRGRGRY